MNIEYYNIIPLIESFIYSLIVCFFSSEDFTDQVGLLFDIWSECCDFLIKHTFIVKCLFVVFAAYLAPLSRRGVPLVKDLELIDTWLAVVFEVDSAENEETVGRAITVSSVGEEAVGPARDGGVTKHSKGYPLGGVNVEHTNVIQGYILSTGEDLVISTTIDN